MLRNESQGKHCRIETGVGNSGHRTWGSKFVDCGTSVLPRDSVVTTDHKKHICKCFFVCQNLYFSCCESLNYETQHRKDRKDERDWRWLCAAICRLPCMRQENIFGIGCVQRFSGQHCASTSLVRVNVYSYQYSQRQISIIPQRHPTM